MSSSTSPRNSSSRVIAYARPTAGGIMQTAILSVYTILTHKSTMNQWFYRTNSSAICAALLMPGMRRENNKRSCTRIYRFLNNNISRNVNMHKGIQGYSLYKIWTVGHSGATDYTGKRPINLLFCSYYKWGRMSFCHPNNRNSPRISKQWLQARKTAHFLDLLTAAGRDATAYACWFPHASIWTHKV